MKKLLVILFIFLATPILIFGQTNDSKLKSSVVPISKSGFYNITEMNIGIGLGLTNEDYSKSFFGLTSSFDLGIIRNLLGGIGTGISFYNGGTLVPLYLDLRYFLNFNKISVYGSGYGGLLFNLTESDHGTNIFINPSAGLLFPLHDNLNANISVGVFVQTSDNQARNSFINLKLGITYMFNNKKN
jgi:hypothetical protein